MINQEVLTAVITPFTNSNQIDFDSLKKIILNLKAFGTHGIVVAGSTGEAATLSFEEKIELFKFAQEFREPNFKIMAGVGSNDTSHVIKTLKEIKSLKLDSVLVVTPYYNKPSQRDLIKHFTEVADHSSFPICLYEIPSRTGTSINVDTVLKLSNHSNIFAIKESNPDLSRIFKIKSSSKLKVYSGDDPNYLPSISLGADGIISVLSHVIGKEICELSKYFGKDMKKTFELQQKIQSTSDIIFQTTNPVGIKMCLAQMGLIAPNLRAPLYALSLEEQKKFLL